MAKFNSLKTSILTLLALLCFQQALPCSMYIVTANGKTMVGNNEDSWGRDARIWFEPASMGKFGVGYVGYARKNSNPDGAMNEHGLAFDAFTMPHKNNVPPKNPNKNDFAYGHLKTIMQTYKTVDEVYLFLNQLNLHVLNGSPIFNGGMLLFADKTGKYLIVEANKMTFGNDSKFALANFSYADTKDLSTIKTERYCKGIAFLNNKNIATSLSFCSALSDTMSVNRSKIGDGTLYTSIYDLDQGLIHLYFFHDYSKCVSLNLKAELAKGEHAYNFADLFPNNSKYQKFLDYQTPQNNKVIFSYLLVASLILFVSSLIFLFGFFKSAKDKYRYLKLALALLGICMSGYALILLSNEGIYYFPSPYNNGYLGIVTLSSYMPFVLLSAIIPMLILMVKIFTHKAWSKSTKYLFALNNITYLIFISLFFYWKLFDLSFNT